MSNPMSFRMQCPKCNSTNVDLEEDQRAYLGGGRHQVQLHCYTCGHLIYGEKRIQAECDRQYSEWERNRKDEAPARQAQAARLEATLASPAETPRARVEAPAPRSERLRPPPAPFPGDAGDELDEDVEDDGSFDDDADTAEDGDATEPGPGRPSGRARAELEPVGPGRATGEIDDETGLEITVPSFPAPLDRKGRALVPCSWPPCARYARPNSKYCSRNCSNKNARARYSRRKDP